jgi:hypothetical protein
MFLTKLNLVEPPWYVTRTRWCGRGGAASRPPIPIVDPNPTFMTTSSGEPLRRKADDQVQCNPAVMFCT